MTLGRKIRRLADACRLWAFSALTSSPGARAHYRRRAGGDSHEAALRNLANKLVGQLHHCLEPTPPTTSTPPGPPNPPPPPGTPRRERPH